MRDHGLGAGYFFEVTCPEAERQPLNQRRQPMRDAPRFEDVEIKVSPFDLALVAAAGIIVERCGVNRLATWAIDDSIDDRRFHVPGYGHADASAAIFDLFGGVSEWRGVMRIAEGMQRYLQEKHDDELSPEALSEKILNLRNIGFSIATKPLLVPAPKVPTPTH